MNRRFASNHDSESIDYSKFDVNRYKKNGKWSIINALDCVLHLSRYSELSDEFWATAKPPLKYLSRKLGMTGIQVVVIAIMVESGKAESWRSLASYLNLSRLTMMTYSEEIEALLSKGWMKRAGSLEERGTYQGFRLNFGVVTALRKNQVYKPEKLDGLTQQQFMDRLELFISKNLSSRDYSNDEVMEWVNMLIEKNPDLPIVKVLKQITDTTERLILIMILVDYAQYADSDDEGLWFQSVEQVIDDDFENFGLLDGLKDGGLRIFKRNLVEFECNDGLINNERYLLSKYSKKDILKDYTPRRSKVRNNSKREDPLIKKSEDIKVKQLFYNPEEEKHIKRLASLLEEDKFEGVQKRLEEEGMRKGFACIFFGSPGTGKTETVLQIAKQTGRDIMQIEIAGMKDKWVGESEKNIKAVFERYRNICENKKVKPILFFNEADAIFGTRFEKTTYAVDKMENAMQNIILQEIENLDGILIATTNLTGALDKAFERRFIYKIEFKNPDTNIKEKIWNSMFKGKLSEEQVRILSAKYNFTGGEIENIARKRTVDYILEGEELNFEQLCLYCDEERLNSNSYKKVGFGV